MIHAYDKNYLSNARKVMAHMLDQAVYRYGMNLQEFYALFLVSSIAERFQRGDCAIIAGRSGAELVEMILEETGARASESSRPDHKQQANRTREYWTGWALAYYQWSSSKTFAQIDRLVPIESIRDMYPRYHEMDIRQFCDAMEERIAEDQQESRIKFYRRRLGISQRQLAEETEIPIRTIQQYEQRQKNINKAQAEYLIRLSRTLECEATELMENNKAR